MGKGAKTGRKDILGAEKIKKRGVCTGIFPDPADIEYPYYQRDSAGYGSLLSELSQEKRYEYGVFPH